MAGRWYGDGTEMGGRLHLVEDRLGVGDVIGHWQRRAREVRLEQQDGLDVRDVSLRRWSHVAR